MRIYPLIPVLGLKIKKGEAAEATSPNFIIQTANYAVSTKTSRKFSYRYVSTSSSSGLSSSPFWFTNMWRKCPSPKTLGTTSSFDNTRNSVYNENWRWGVLLRGVLAGTASQKLPLNLYVHSFVAAPLRRQRRRMEVARNYPARSLSNLYFWIQLVLSNTNLN